MIFDAATARLIQRGKVTATIRHAYPRSATPGETFTMPTDNGPVHLLSQERFPVTLAHAWQQHHEQIGMSRPTFEAWWLARYDPWFLERASMHSLVNRARTGVIDHKSPSDVFWGRWACQVVWVVVFVVERDPARLLRHQAGRWSAPHELEYARGHGPAVMADEPEALDERSLDEFCAVGGQVDAATLAARWEERRARPLAERLTLALADAEGQRTDVSSSVRLIERKIHEIEQSVMRRAA